jgi:hypothetical protein
MKRTLVVVAAVVGFAAAAGASTFTVVSRDAGDTADQNIFVVGETILLKFTGDAQDNTNAAQAIFGQLNYNTNGDITDFVSNSQTPMFATVSGLAQADNFSYIMNQSNTANTPPSTQIQIATVRLLATAPGSSLVQIGGEAFDFFGDYRPGSELPDTVHSFTIIPEPATAGLIGLGLLGLILGGRRRA